MPSSSMSGHLSLYVAGFAGCLVLAFFMWFEPLIIVETPVDLFHCMFHCSIPDDTKKNNSVLKGKWFAQGTRKSKPQLIATQAGQCKGPGLCCSNDSH